MSQKQMRIGMSLRGHGYHLAAWRHPDVPADASVRIDHYVRTAQAAERGKCDLIFFADGLGIREHDVPRGALARQGRDIVDLDPLTLLPALAMVTDHIGLVTTGGPVDALQHVWRSLWLSAGRSPVPLDAYGPQELHSSSERLRARVRRDQPTIRQLSQEVAGMGGCSVIGTADEVANVMQAWFEQGACDGFNITPPRLPGGCDAAREPRPAAGREPVCPHLRSTNCRGKASWNQMNRGGSVPVRCG